MNNIYQKLQNNLDSIRKKTDFVPDIALVLGSGLGGFADECVDIHSVVSYSDIEDFPVSTVPGHKGRFVFGMVGGAKVAVMQGRVHLYEGYSADEAVQPIRLLKMMGAKTLFLTNAAGGINPYFSAGDFMLIRDQISVFVPNPLIGGNIDELGVRFPDMSEIYDKTLNNIILHTAAELGISMKQGTYVQLNGPSYESPAEIRMLGKLGADAVGMSTAVEAIAARHAGMKVCGISCISNLAAGISANPLSHEEVQLTADKAAPLFKALLKNSISNMNL